MQTLNQTELILALILLIGAVTSFALEKIKIETTALCLLGLVLVLTLFGLENWPSFSEFLSILSSEAPLAIIAMFIVSSALSKQGVIERLTLSLQKLTFVGFSPFMLLLLTAVACLSAFINNTPVVVILLPVAISLSRILGVASSKLLIPISYASIFGGCCTLIGTSTNILASGFMSSSKYYPDMGSMGMFELTKIGFPLMILGILFLVFFGKKLLPEREALSKILADIDRKEFVTEALVIKNSPMIGQMVKEATISKISGVRLLEVVRLGNSLSTPLSEIKLIIGSGALREQSFNSIIRN